MKLPISKRLLCCAAQVPNGARVADIGCDHGYLSIYLLQTKRVVFSHACDLREKPILKAQENARRFCVFDQMQFSQADGLAAVDPANVDTILCTGMGGDLITHILQAAPWLKDEAYVLILQPQSSGQQLRRMLCQEGFRIEREVLVEDGGFLYNVITSRYGKSQPLSPGQQYCSPQLLESGDVLLPRYLDRLEHALQQTVFGIRCATGPVEEEKLEYYCTALQEIQQMKEQLLCQQ